MDIKQMLAEIGKNLPANSLEFKTYGKSGKQMATTRTINVHLPTAPIPGKEGLVGRMQLTFCVNFLDIADAATYQARHGNEVENYLEAISPEERQKLLEKYL